MIDDKILNKLFKLADKSLKNKEFPVSAIIYKDRKIISYGYNKRNRSQKTTDHAEIIAIQKANKKLKSWRLQDYNMIVTLEPCEMCKTVIKEARLKNTYFLIKRLNTKKQYKCSQFELFKIDTPEKTKYLTNINHFFDSKR